MSKKAVSKYTLPITLTMLSLILYVIRWTAFSGEALHNEMVRFLIGDLAFLFLQVLIVTLLLEAMLRKREREAFKEKLNMIVGAFFSETGFDLLRMIVRIDRTLPQIKPSIAPVAHWSEADYLSARTIFREYEAVLEPQSEQLAELRSYLHARKDSILMLLTNQALLEHEQFTDLLWSITHLAEELEARSDLLHLPDSDVSHLTVDILRAYRLLGDEWLDYLAHLKKNYPYLFSLALRNSPLEAHPHPEITTV